MPVEEPLTHGVDHPPVEEPSAPPEKPRVRLFSPDGVGVATFIGSPVMGGALLAFNFSRLKQTDRALYAAVGGLALTVVLVFVGAQIRFTGLGAVGIVLALGARALTKGLQGRELDEHERRGGRLFSNWVALAVSAPMLVASVLAVVQSTRSPELVVRQGGAEVYYEEAGEEATARALLAYLTVGGFGQQRTQSAWIERDGGTVHVKFVMPADPSGADGLRRLAAEMSRTVFDGRPVVVDRCDQNRESCTGTPPVAAVYPDPSGLAPRDYGWLHLSLPPWETVAEVADPQNGQLVVREEVSGDVVVALWQTTAVVPTAEELEQANVGAGRLIARSEATICGRPATTWRVEESPGAEFAASALVLGEVPVRVLSLMTAVRGFWPASEALHAAILAGVECNL